MFRHGRQRRMLRRAAQLNPIPGPFIQDLRQASQLMSAGHYQSAQDLYARLALAAESSGHPRQAANLHAQAAQAAAMHPSREAALLHARAAFNGFQRLAMLPRLKGFLASFVSLLRSQGLQAEANLLLLEYGGQINHPAGQPPASQEEAQPGRLPTTCPQCGAPVRSDEVEWIDAYSAECAFCGGVIAAA